MTAFLIARLEAATGPSRELDASIARHIGWETLSDKIPDVEPGPFWKDPNGFTQAECPYYTISIDAAWSICEDAAFLFAAKMGGEFQVRLKSKTLFECKGIATTLELSWCIAALKAREEANSNNEKL